MSGEYSAGGIIPGEPIRVTLDPDECILSPRLRIRCVRTDHEHTATREHQLRALLGDYGFTAGGGSAA